MTNVYQASQLLFCLHITLKMPLNKAIENGVQVKLFKIFVHTYSHPIVLVSSFYAAGKNLSSFLNGELFYCLHT